MKDAAEYPPFDPQSDEPHAYGSSNWDRLWMRPNRTFTVWGDAARYAITFDGYAFLDQQPQGRDRCERLLGQLQAGEPVEPNFVELRCSLFLWQRCMRHWSSEGEAYENEARFGLRLHQLVCEAWEREAKGHTEEIQLAYGKMRA